VRKQLVEESMQLRIGEALGLPRVHRVFRFPSSGETMQHARVVKWARSSRVGHLKGEGTGVAPMRDCPGALVRIKGSLATLAADAPLTRPARSRGLCNYRSDADCRQAFTDTACPTRSAGVYSRKLSSHRSS
jgi:hypothetical protein